MSIPKINISLHPLWLLPFGVILFIFPDYRAVMGILALFIHEAGHIAAILLLGMSIDAVSILACGIEIKMKRPPSSRLHKIIISSSGCIANLITAAASFGLAKAFLNLSCFFYYFSFCSIIMCLFNALPVKGLDGGEVAEQLLDKFFLPDTVYSISKSVSIVFTVILWILACYILLITMENISLFMVCFLLFYSNISG